MLLWMSRTAGGAGRNRARAGRVRVNASEDGGVLGRGSTELAVASGIGL